MTFIDLIATIEKHYNIEIDFEDGDPSEFTTLSGLAKLVSETKELS